MLYDDWLQSLPSRGCVVTPTQRLATYLKHRWQSQHSEETAFTPHFLSIAQFFHRFFQINQHTFEAPYRVLNAFEAQLQWEDLLESQAPHLSKEIRQKWAKQASEARNYLTLWEIPEKEWSTFHENAILGKVLQDLKPLEKTQKPVAQALKASLSDSLFLPFSHLFLLAFEEIPPLWSKFFQQLNASGIPVHTPDFSNTDAPTLAQIQCGTPEEEKNALMGWLNSKNPLAPYTLGVIIPDLDQRRDEIEDLFEKNTHHHWNLSGGKPLFGFPLIETALKVLALHTEASPSLETWKALLRSRYLPGFETEYSARFQLIEALEQSAESELSLKTVRTCLQELILSSPANHLCNWLDTQEELMASSKEKPLSYSEWKTHSLDSLNALQFAQEISLSSLEIDLLKRFQRLLDDWANLAWPHSSVFGEKAFAQLERLAKQTLFQPPSLNHAPIQCLTPLEASGLCFDATWFLSATQTLWPAPPSPNPLIPAPLRSLFPRGDPLREYQFAQQLTHRLCASTQTMTFSYASMEAGEPRQPSPLLSGPFETYISAVPPKEMSSVTRIEDSQGSPIDTTMQAGSHWLKDQAACPFKAFAKHRLKLSEKENRVPGVSAKTRGNVVHLVLQDFWRKTKTQSRLKALSEKEISTQLKQLIQKYLGVEKISKTLLEIESVYLLELLFCWLSIEKKRPPFTIRSLEKVSYYAIKPLHFKLRIDRIDEEEDGSLTLIDYKTGRVSTASWQSDRLFDPQMPLYALTHSPEGESLLFAQLHPDDMRFKGLLKEGLLFEKPAFQALKLSNSFEMLRDTWQEQLQTLTEEFASGHAEVHPHHAQACQYCHLRPVCRIDEVSSF